MPPKNGMQLWAAVDEHLANLLAPADEQLAATRKAIRKAKLPAISVSPLQGKFLLS